MKFPLIAIFAMAALASSERLTIQGSKFKYGGEDVYLSGTNAAWVHYGNDFGNNQWESSTKERWTQEITELGQAGANSVRVWLHVEGEQNPQFDSNGFVVGTDASNTLISDLTKFLNLCQSQSVFANLVLWNGALMRPQQYKDLFFDNNKLQSYLDNALIPMVQELGSHPALAGWEIINEPEGSILYGQTDNDPCYDTNHLNGARDGLGRAPGWSGANVPMQNMLKFINWQADAIHQNDPLALVNVGSWSQFAQTDSPLVCSNANQCGFNHYKEECLTKAGNRNLGVMDFWQFHCYFYNSPNWTPGQPWTGLRVEDYGLPGPLIVGEFPTETFANNEGRPIPENRNTNDLVTYLYENDYDGGWTWMYGYENGETEAERQDILEAVALLDGRTDHGTIDVTIS